jgi:branched-subunit amino acid ABC-type transport system permease component
MTGILASVIDGVLVGAVYGLAAMGLTLIWGVMRVINLTHGAMIVLGMFVVYFLTKGTGLSPYEGVPAAVIAAFVAGIAIYWTAPTTFRSRCRA